MAVGAGSSSPGTRMVSGVWGAAEPQPVAAAGLTSGYGQGFYGLCSVLRVHGEGGFGGFLRDVCNTVLHKRLISCCLPPPRGFASREGYGPCGAFSGANITKKSRRRMRARRNLFT